MDYQKNEYWATRLTSLSQKIKIGIIGMGSMGKGLFYQIHRTPGLECSAICDLQINRATDCAIWMKRKYKVVSKQIDITQAVADRTLAVCEDGNLLARCELVDVIIEASNSPLSGGQFTLEAIQSKKHVILMNAETDLLFGPYLANLAFKNDVVYSSCDGDQPGVIKHLLDEVSLWGFKIIMAGNIKGFLDRYANPETIIPEANKRNLDYQQATAYTDGTKLNIEMALVANSFGFKVSIPGMVGPRSSHVQDIFHLFDFHRLHQDRQPMVDYILGAEPGGGVFVVGYCDDPYQMTMLSYYKMGDGPFYLFYRPYHLCHIEAMKTIAEAYLDGRGLLQPTGGYKTNVYTYAKRDLKKGTKLDGIGGFCCYGLIENVSNDGHPGLPVCLADDVTLNRNLYKDQKIDLQDVAIQPGRFDLEIYDKTLKGGGTSV